MARLPKEYSLSPTNLRTMLINHSLRSSACLVDILLQL